MSSSVPKKFTESYVLGEIVETHLTTREFHGTPQGRANNYSVEALRGGDRSTLIPEYTGTIRRRLKSDSTYRLDQIRNSLKSCVGMTAPLGFNKTYALVNAAQRSATAGIRTI